MLRERSGKVKPACYSPAVMASLERRVAIPDDSILAEESGAASGSSGRRWIVDPLDGTTNYAHGLPIFAVSIGLERAGETVLGVVHDPIREETYLAERGR